jgi:hypothetical protein
MKNKYVNPQLLKEEVSRFRKISEYAYFNDNAKLDEEDDNKVDQLTMDDFNSSKAPAGGAPEAGGQPPAEGQPPMGGAPEGGASDAGGASAEDPFAGGGDVAPAPDAAAGAPDAGGEPSTEVDVTDIVNDTKATTQKTEEVSGKVDQTLKMVNDLMTKIGGIEGNVKKMDQALAKIDSIYKEFQLSKPPSPEEVKKAMAQNSYPFNVPLDEYGQEGTDKNQTEMEQKHKKLSLSNLLADFNERDVRSSFNPPDPQQDKIARTLPGYRV